MNITLDLNSSYVRHFDGDHIKFDLDDMLYDNWLIAHVWCVNDVEHIRPDLTPRQCWQVLQDVDDRIDSEFGITWTTLENAATDQFGPAPTAESHNVGGQQLTLDEFLDTYPLVKNAITPNADCIDEFDPGSMFLPHGPDLEFVRQQPENRVWTIIHHGDGEFYISSGLQFGDRVGYLVSTKPVPPGIACSVPLAYSPDYVITPSSKGEQS